MRSTTAAGDDALTHSLTMRVRACCACECRRALSLLACLLGFFFPLHVWVIRTPVIGTNKQTMDVHDVCVNTIYHSFRHVVVVPIIVDFRVLITQTYGT